MHTGVYLKFLKVQMLAKGVHALSNMSNTRKVILKPS